MFLTSILLTPQYPPGITLSFNEQEQAFQRVLNEDTEAKAKDDWVFHSLSVMETTAYGSIKFVVMYSKD